MLRIRPLIVTWCFACGCACAHALAWAGPSYVSLPPLAALAHGEEQLKKIEVDIDCAGVSGVEGVPDGWSFSATADGENYTVLFMPRAGPKEVHFGQRPPRVAVTFRGQWSDCYSAHATAYVTVGGESRKRVFHEKSFLGPLVETPPE